jgi:hypothetical protein
MKVAGFKVFLVALSVSTTGFFLGGLAPAYGRHPGRKAVAAASTDDCKKDSDCAVVPDDCCPCNQGGALRALPKKQKDAYEKDRKKRCAGTLCTEVMSQDPTCVQHPFCGAGICELEDAPSPAK